MTPEDIVLLIRDRMRTAGIEPLDVSIRAYPDEVNFIVLVDPSVLTAAATVGNALDDELDAGEGTRSFVIVRKASAAQEAKSPSPVKLGVHDPRATDLIRLISARSRVSLAQPSLTYVRDARANLAAVTAARHHLVFGRRGAGKTALMVEARRQLAGEGAITCWVNVQSLRHEPPERVVLYLLDELLMRLMSHQRSIRPESVVAADAASLYETVRSMLASVKVEDTAVLALVPRMQRTLARFLDLEGARLYLFVDDFYYVARTQQPRILDVLHACLRETDAWLKVASIRHLTRWFQSSPPMGLQTIHDADLIDLDVTLQEPVRAKEFLENVLRQYATHVSVPALTRLFSGEALDRLVLASGAVPRDYLVLASSAIAKAQRRQNARLVGVQDVNQAAGDAAGVKLQELEDDMASNEGTAEKTLTALKTVRNFCLEDKSFTYFLVRYRDKEDEPKAYSLLTDLMDVRMVHLIDSGVSDPHAAVQRSEAFMLDLSQFSGSRLKQRINVLDFAAGRIVARETRSSVPDRAGNTPLQVISILRGAPTFELRELGRVP